MSHLQAKIAAARARGDIRAAQVMERIEQAERRRKRKPNPHEIRKAQADAGLAAARAKAAQLAQEKVR